MMSWWRRGRFSATNVALGAARTRISGRNFCGGHLPGPFGTPCVSPPAGLDGIDLGALAPLATASGWPIVATPSSPRGALAGTLGLVR